MQNPKRVLCYGDSNTWGYVPSMGEKEERFPESVRWTGRLASLGKNKLTVIEEGLSGRTSGIEDPDRAGRNGAIYLGPCLETHNPLDLVILMLGSNDLKSKYNPDSLVITQRMRSLIRITREFARNLNDQVPQILLVSALVPDPVYSYDFFKYDEIIPIGKQLNIHYEKMAEVEKVEFLNILTEIEPSKTDGVHLDPGTHKKLAELMFAKSTHLLK